MKKLLLLVAFAMFSLTNMNAQSNAIKTGPVALALGDINLAFEHQMSEKMSVILKADYFAGFKVGDTKVDAFGVGGGVRYYFITDHELSGLYANPQVKYSSANYLSVGATLGYQFHWDNNLILDLGIGPQKYISLDDAVSYSGFLPMVTLGIGYAF